MKNIIKGIIFDFDGVLVDSENFYLSFWADFFRDKNLDLVLSPLGFTLEEYLMKTGMSNSIEEVNKTKHIKESIFFSSAPINQHFRSFIFEKINDVKFIIGSNNSSHLICKFLVRNNLDGIFQDVITPDCGFKPKPSSDIFNECLKRIDLPRDHVLVIEDSQIGKIAADSAGLKSLLLPFPKVDKDIEILRKYFD